MIDIGFKPSVVYAQPFYSETFRKNLVTDSVLDTLCTKHISCARCYTCVRAQAGDVNVATVEAQLTDKYFTASEGEILSSA